MHRPESYSEIPRRIRGILEPSVSGSSTSSENGNQMLTKVLVNVTVERSLGPVHVLLSPEKTVEDLIKAALDVYLKEKKRPSLTESDPQFYELHYSQFALESLIPKEKLINLGSRNFFLCSKRTSPVNSSNSEQAKKASANK